MLGVDTGRGERNASDAEKDEEDDETDDLHEKNSLEVCGAGTEGPAPSRTLVPAPVRVDTG